MTGADDPAALPPPPPPALIATIGLLSLAVAMGIGRFAFTPLLPLMQRDGSLAAPWPHLLAAANYLGYWIGAAFAARVPLAPARLLAASLVAIGFSTAAMGLASSPAGWLVWRFAAGVASAWALVATSSWALAHLARAGRPSWAGVVYAGVGSGIAVAGLFCLVAPPFVGDASALWATLGAGTALVIAPVLLALRRWPVELAAAAGGTGRSGTVPGSTTGLVVCYGVLGFGYILPATFLPAMARALLDDPAVFGWAWPLFGAAAALSTLLAAALLRLLGRLRLWALAHGVMAVGVTLPTLMPTLPAIALAALLVGGTFMVVTMAGLQEVRERAARAGQDATPLLARMTAAFALGQFAGPLLSMFDASGEGLNLGLRIAAVALLASAGWLWVNATTTGNHCAIPRS